MISKNTVLILGAGSSMDFGFPSGDELAYEISRYGSRHLINDAFARENNIDWTEVKSFKQALSISQLSVDTFLENRADESFYKIGRLAIAKVLLTCEVSDRLFIGKPPYENFERNRTSNRRPPNWYKLLWNRLVEVPEQETNEDTLSHLFDRFDQNRLSVITFNYDRSLERFLNVALECTTGEGSAECAKKISESIPIIHVYGSLGPLLAGDGEVEVPYNSKGQGSFVLRSWENIDLVRRSKERNKYFVKADKLLLEAEGIVFLGFGFDQTNFRRLQLSKDMPAFHANRLLGTAMGLPATTHEVLADIRDVDGNRAFFELLDTTIYDYLYRADSTFSLPENEYKQSIRILKRPR
ncbi:MAG: hypothetical protein CEE38_22310 [Planctomycetes bacterium B3_Pla]|nr:MAG: hypothetical protein CEE38_22310 [Planctomycetes bacterium B3_Pla]